MPLVAFNLDTGLASWDTGTGMFPMDFRTPEIESLDFLSPESFGDDYTIPIVVGGIIIVALSAVGLYAFSQMDKAAPIIEKGFSTPVEGLTAMIGDVGKNIQNILPF